MIVEDIMTADPITAKSTATIRAVIQLLFERDVRHLPIVEDGELVGIISDRDLRTFLVPATVELEKPSEVAARLARPISSVMGGDVVSVAPETDLSELIEIMLDQKIGAVPVVESGTKELVGIVSYTDVLRAAQDALAED